MDEYISREATAQKIKQIGAENYSGMYANIGMTHAAQIVERMPAADVAPVVHGVPISKNRSQKYEIYEEAGTGENGETLYRKRIYVDEKNSVEYCPACGKRLCSRFRNFCPNCGAKMDGKDSEKNGRI